MNNTIGIFYELPDGKIAYTYGWDGTAKKISYYFDDGEGGRTVDEQEFHGWKPRNDLRDFPAPRDPRLPYLFDLHWDIKYLSQLRLALEQGHEDEGEIRAAMKEQGIGLDWKGECSRAKLR